MNIMNVRRVVIVVGAIVWAALAGWGFMRDLSNIQTKATNEKLLSVANSNAEDVRFVFKRYTRNVEVVSQLIGSYEGAQSEELLRRLKNLPKDDAFLRLAIDSMADGKSYTSDGHVFDIARYKYIDKIKDGKPFVTDVINIARDGVPAVNIVVPLEGKNGEFDYALRGVIATKELTAVFDNTFASVGGYYHLVDGDGEYVSPGNSTDALLMDSNYFGALDKLEYKEGFSAEQIRQDFKKQKNGYSQYELDGQKRYCYYHPVGINDWMVLMLVPKDIVEQTSNAHLSNAFWLLAQIIFILLIFTVYIYISQKRARNNALNNEKSFKMLAEHTNKVIFEWDFSQKKMSALSNFQTLFGREAIAFTDTKKAISSKSIHADDEGAFKKVLESVRNGKNVKNVKIRVSDHQGTYHWCDLSIIIIKDEYGNSYKAVGTLENVDEQVKQEEVLRRKAETDLLTGLCNKTTTEYLIKEVLESKGDDCKHALLIIDIDNFKDINDKLGHLYGDMVLSQLADLLKATFRADDILGRIGGDEFFVLLKNCNSAELLHKKANSIAEKFHKSYKVGDTVVNVSVSIGVAVFPEHGRNFDELYKAADAALYASKEYGKNRFSVFDACMSTMPESVKTEIDVLGGLQKNFKENRLEYIFKLLYGTDQSKDAIVAVLQLLAEQFGFSRVNVFEGNEANTRFSCTFEWCARYVSSIKDSQQNLTREYVSHIIEGFENNGDMFTKSVKDFPEAYQARYHDMKIKSMFYFAIVEQDKIIGCIVFQDCVNDELLLDVNDTYELRTICQVLTTFMLKQRLNEREKRQYFAVENVMNNMDEYVYVITPGSMEIIYENHKVRETTRRDSVGRNCYKAYMGQESQCEICPIRDLKGDVQKSTIEIYNQKYDMYMRTTGTTISWFGGKKVHMVCCVDVTEYKK